MFGIIEETVESLGPDPCDPKQPHQAARAGEDADVQGNADGLALAPRSLTGRRFPSIR